MKINENDVDLMSLKKATILIAEDEESHFMFLEAVLINYNTNLIHAYNGVEAIKEFKNNKAIDLILMDINLPIMDGIEATLEIRKTNSEIPIIAISAYSMDSYKNKALEAGCNYFITKPISRKMLLEVLNSYFIKIPCA